MRQHHHAAPGLLLIVLAVALAACTPDTPAPAAATAHAEDAELTREGVTVEAVGMVEGTPDVLTALVGVSVEAGDVDSAYAQGNEAAAAVRDALLDAGVDEADLQTAHLSLGPQHQRGPDHEPEGYVARTQLRVQLRDLETAGAVLDDAVGAAGGNATLHSLGFQLDDDSELVVQARAAAFDEARAKAEQYADLADRALGELVGLAEADHPHAPIPGAVPRVDAPVAEDAAAPPPPVEPGAEEVQVRIRATWALN